MNFNFLINTEENIQAIAREKTLQEKETSSGINLLPKNYVHAKQFNRRYYSFKLFQFQLSEALNFMICTLCITISTVYN